MTPLVSILIPAYNAEPWIADALRSALRQTWTRREIIIVDDGSKDQTAAVARQFASPEVQVVSQKNQGASAARNKAYSLCQGDYIQWLDADDLLGRDKISRQMELVERQANRRMLYSCGWGHFYQRPRKARFKPTPLWTDLSPVEWLRRKMGGGYHMQTGTWLVSRELSQLAGPWDIRLERDNDGEYLTRILRHCEAVRFVPEAKVYYRLSGSCQITQMMSGVRKTDSLWLSMQLHINCLRSLDDSQSARTACLKYLRTWSIFFYPNRMDLLRQARQLAAELGGELPPPELSWKYAWIRKLFGWRAVRSLQIHYNLKKLAVLQAWDGTVLRWEGPEKFWQNGDGNVIF